MAGPDPDNRVAAEPSALSTFTENALQAIGEYQAHADALSQSPKQNHYAVWQAARESLTTCGQCHGTRWDHAADRLCDACHGSGFSATVTVHKRKDRHSPGGVAVDMLFRDGSRLTFCLNHFDFGLQGCSGVRVEELPAADNIELAAGCPVCAIVNSRGAVPGSCGLPNRRPRIVRDKGFLKILGLLLGFFILGPIIGYFSLIALKLMKPFAHLLLILLTAAAIGIGIALYIRDRRSLNSARTRKMRSSKT
jgi:hypothetical protein